LLCIGVFDDVHFAKAERRFEDCPRAERLRAEGFIVSTVLTSFAPAPASGHARWVRASHWIIAISVMTLMLSGFVILMAHPRLYWGAIGNDLTPALWDLPISRNHWHRGWTPSIAFFPSADSPVTAERTYDIFNQNGWARSLHFLAAWCLSLTAAFYTVAAIMSGHFWRDLRPRAVELTPRRLWGSLRSHSRDATTPGPPYNPLQKCAYVAVVFLALPLMALTGMTMSPAITAAYPGLLELFGGSQSARTLHFGIFVLLACFLIGHVFLVITSGFKRQLRAMTRGI
jgi:thiosulfate reductase cytochrome b subunit